MLLDNLEHSTRPNWTGSARWHILLTSSYPAASSHAARGRRLRGPLRALSRSVLAVEGGAESGQADLVGAAHDLRTAHEQHAVRPQRVHEALVQPRLGVVSEVDHHVAAEN